MIVLRRKMFGILGSAAKLGMNHFNAAKTAGFGMEGLKEAGKGVGSLVLGTGMYGAGLAATGAVGAGIVGNNVLSGNMGNPN